MGSPWKQRKPLKVRFRFGAQARAPQAFTACASCPVRGGSQVTAARAPCSSGGTLTLHVWPSEA